MKYLELNRVINPNRYQRSGLFLLAILCYMNFTSPTFAEESTVDAQPIFYNRDIRPILSQHCFHCHGPDSEHREAELRLNEEAGVSYVFGETELDDNLAWQRLNSTDPEEQMPPPSAHIKVKPEELARIKQWIEQGAQYEGHWAFVPPTKSDVPQVKKSDWIRNPIDAFVLSRLERDGLNPNQEATREQLIRRVTLDLIGLPPSVADVDAFLKDNSPDAYEKVVDRLLASPHFGERLAIPWLDAARYADTNGFSIDDHRDMWLWREWVIDAFNRNLPYDQFVTEQLAGDLLPDATDAQRLATGFLRNSMNTHEGGTLPQEYRVIYIADKVDTVSTVLMGLTMRCAQCHSHKYDPITHEDYYRFYAFFDTAYEPGKGAENGNTDPLQRMDGLLTDADALQRDLTQRIATLRRYQQHPPELIEARAQWERTVAATAENDLAAALEVPARQRADQQWSTINKAFSKTTQLWDRHVSTLRREIAVLERDLKTGQASVMVMKEKGPRQTFVLTRGQYDQPNKAQPVGPGVPSVFPPLVAPSTESAETAETAATAHSPEAIETVPVATSSSAISTENSTENSKTAESNVSTRLTLARWLMRPDHPLTARVAVNRHWQMLFGRGLVSTPYDFGSQGAFPTHPLLLDWLALEYSTSDWDTKRLIKTMVSSATYRQSSSASRTLIEQDPQNEWLARAPRFRLPAEFIRDGALAIAGDLNLRVGGPSVTPSQPHGLWREISHFGYGNAFTAQAFYPSDSSGQNRRSMYTFWKRTSPPPTMIAFDAPSREVCTVLRSRTNTPLQALVLLNDPEFIAAARKLAELAWKEEDASIDHRIRFLFRRATAREPVAEETETLRKRYETALKVYQQDNDAAQALVGIDLVTNPQPPSASPTAQSSSQQHAALTVVASIVLNLDEVITRE